MKKILSHILLLAALCLPPLAARGQQTDTPRRGEGISLFLQRHGRTPKLYHDDFVELNRKKPGNDEELLLGVKYTIPPLKADAGTRKKTSRRGTVREPLLGRKHRDVKVTSNTLRGTCFYLVSGHGGPDPGAIGRVGKHELHEDEYAYDIILRLARDLLAEGADVRIIIQDAKDGIRDDAYLSNSKRETCMGDPIPLGQVARLKQRCDKINALYAKDRRKYSYVRALFVHVDSRGRGKQMDVFFYHAPGSTQGRQLASALRTTFKQKYDTHQPGRGFTGTVSGRDLYVLRNTAPVAAFVELGNIQNRFDLRRLVQSDNREALAKWLKDGIVKDFKSK